MCVLKDKPLQLFGAKNGLIADGCQREALPAVVEEINQNAHKI